MERPHTLLIHYDKGTPAIAKQIVKDLQGRDGPAKVDAMKKAIMLLLNGETLPQLLNTIVRFVLPSQDPMLQKLLLLYLEIIDIVKVDADAGGGTMNEMYICQHLKNNLNNSNIYTRVATLRFICHLNDKHLDIIRELKSSVVGNLQHKHPYVRRNAILAVMTIDKLPQGQLLLVDAPETIEEVLSKEEDPSAKRSAFLMLSTCDQDRAINYLLSHVDSVSGWGELLQMVVLELIRKVLVSRMDKGEKETYINIVKSLLNAPSTATAVAYECAGILVSLSSKPTDIVAAANTYCQLLRSQSDNNVKLIALDRLIELKSSHRDIMVDLTMDLLRALNCRNTDIQKKALQIVLELITERNINGVVLMLKNEAFKTQGHGGEFKNNGKYRQMLIQAIRICALKFPKVASTVDDLLMDFSGDNNVASAIDMLHSVREIIEMNHEVRVSIITRVLDNLYRIRASRVCSCALWTIGEYCRSLDEVENGIATIKHCLGELPFLPVSEEGEDTDSSEKVQQKMNSVTVSSVLADASEPAFSDQGSLTWRNLRSFLLTGDFFLGAVVASTLTKLVLRLEGVQSSKVEVNKASTQAVLIMVSMLQLGQSPVLPHPIDNDSYDRIVVCIRLLCSTGDNVRKIWLQSCRQSFVKMLSEKQLRESEELNAKAQISHAQPDDLIHFDSLKTMKGRSQLELEDMTPDDEKLETGEFIKDGDGVNKLNRRIHQLTGFSDPVYAEAFVTVHRHDIVLDITIINRTKQTLQNFVMELIIKGGLEIVELKPVEDPQNNTLAPESNMEIKVKLMVVSTDTGVICGHVVYGTSNGEKTVVLSEICFDVGDYMSPAVCTDEAFRTLWAELEWKRKVDVDTEIQDEKEFLDHIIKLTNMKCLTAPLDGNCGFLTANLYAKSVFGEDALVNVSIEKKNNGRLGGSIKIKSKSQGIALGLSNKISLKQKGKGGN
ncbi:hypothetical protein CISIN_1g048218mg [Citrus sinensis]|uniref:Coatomer subunit beta n=1 Tax=Citrus sinensis TaxID=2711 RepID=A0A067FIT5_CITSI|nr:hypothetical protein CISIN_1g048218mg [Citrus sinensis]